MTRKRVAILGSTGSVGTQALEVVARHPEQLEVAALAAGTNVDLLAEQVRRYRPAVVSLATESAATTLAEKLRADRPDAADAHGTGAHAADAHVADAHATDAHAADAHAADAHAADAHAADAHAADAHAADAHAADAHATDAHAAGAAAASSNDSDGALAAASGAHVSDELRIVWGSDGLLAATSGSGADVVLNAVVGAPGLAATHEAVTSGIDVALANKESLVMAGEIIMPTARDMGVAILPVDSEPNALHQCLRGAAIEDVRRLVLTASGGPFRGWDPDRLAHVTAAEALAHPTWKMGPRITIDSATLMNKGFEVIETHWLFGLPVAKIDVVIHPQSIVHSLIELVDGSMIAHAGPTDMRLPIQDALSYPERWDRAVEALDLPESSPWTFEPADPARYPALGMAREALRAGGTAPAMLNAADEVAVAAFLRGELPFDRILPTVSTTLESLHVTAADSLEAVFAADHAARAEANRILGS